MTKKCNDDCLNCVLDNCIYDDTPKMGRPKKEKDPSKETNQVKKKPGRPKKKYKKNDPEYYNRWYHKNRDRILERAHKRYLEKKDEILAYQKIYREKHKKEWQKGGKYWRGSKEDAAHSVLQSN